MKLRVLIHPAEEGATGQKYQLCPVVFPKETLLKKPWPIIHEAAEDWLAVARVVTG
jgi:hypothetical protein